MNVVEFIPKPKPTPEQRARKRALDWASKRFKPSQFPSLVENAMTGIRYNAALRYENRKSKQG